MGMANAMRMCVYVCERETKTERHEIDKIMETSAEDVVAGSIMCKGGEYYTNRQDNPPPWGNYLITLNRAKQVECAGEKSWGYGSGEPIHLETSLATCMLKNM